MEQGWRLGVEESIATSSLAAGFGVEIRKKVRAIFFSCQSSKWGRNNERGHAILNSDQINCAISIIHKYVYDPFRSDFTLGCSYVGTVYLISSLLIFFFSYAQGLIN